MPKRVLFVCTGNTCRSPMAVGLLRKMAPHIELDIRSAGTAGYSGSPASTLAIDAMHEVGIDIADHRSSTLNGDMIEEADKVYLMREFDPERTDSDYPDVPDPIGLDIDAYRLVLTMLERSMHEVIKIL